MATLGPFEASPALAVGVSGGADSMALAILADAWAKARGGTVLALIVDHGLRAELAEEAVKVAGWLGARGLPSRILAWRGAKPRTGIQAAAREARYRLLAEAAAAAGILHLLTAHQLEDQAETVAMRAAHASGPAGLAGMAAVRELEGVRLLRPLLGVPKARLEATLRRIGQPWVEDPSNRHPRFERARLRASGRHLPADPTVVEAAATRRRCEEAAVARLLARCATPHALGWVTLAREPLDMADGALRQALLAAVLRSIGGATFAPRRDAVGALLEERGDPLTRRRTLAGCILAMRADRITLCREPAAARDIRVLRPGDRLLWDGRFEVMLVRCGGAVEVRRLGLGGRLRLPPGLRDALRMTNVPAAAVESLPALWRGEELLDCPPLRNHGLSAAGIEVVVRPSPHHPLAVAPFGRLNVV